LIGVFAGKKGLTTTAFLFCSAVPQSKFLLGIEGIWLAISAIIGVLVLR